MSILSSLNRRVIGINLLVLFAIVALSLSFGGLRGNVLAQETTEEPTSDVVPTEEATEAPTEQPTDPPAETPEPTEAPTEEPVAEVTDEPAPPDPVSGTEDEPVAEVTDEPAPPDPVSGTDDTNDETPVVVVDEPPVEFDAFMEDFTDWAGEGLTVSGWDLTSDEAGNAFVTSSLPDATVQVNNLDWTDSTLSVALRVDAGNTASIAFRVSADSEYSVLIDTNGNSRLYRGDLLLTASPVAETDETPGRSRMAYGSYPSHWQCDFSECGWRCPIHTYRRCACHKRWCCLPYRNDEYRQCLT